MKDLFMDLFGGWRRIFRLLAIAIVFLLLVCLVCGCRTQYVPKERVTTEYLRTDSTLFEKMLAIMRESVKINHRSSDSLTHVLKETTILTEAGDTARHDRTEYIYLSSNKEKEYERTIEEQKDSIKILNDRLESVKADSIQVPYPVERKLTWWEQTKMDVGGWAISIAVIAMVVIALMAWRAKKFK